MIRDDIKTATIAAMKGGDKETTATLRLVQAAIKNRDIEARTGVAPKDDDALVTEVLQKMIKQRRSRPRSTARVAARTAPRRRKARSRSSSASYPPR